MELESGGQTKGNTWDSNPGIISRVKFDSALDRDSISRSSLIPTRSFSVLSYTDLTGY